MNSCKLRSLSRCLPAVVLLLATLAFNLAAQAQASDSGDATATPITFTQEKTPNPAFNNFLFGISGDSENDIWAVGTFATGALGLHFDGSKWRAVPMALPFMADMRGVSVLSLNDVWAVGCAFNSNTQHFTSVIEHFDGQQWSVVPSPHFASGDQLFAVKAIASNDVFVVGESHSDNQKPLPLVERFDGTTWSVVPTPPLQKGQTVSLGAIGAISHSDLWVTGNGPAQSPTIMHFDGQQFQNVPFPMARAALGQLAAIATNDVWVVGVQSKGSAGATLAAHWDGQAWTVVPSPNLTTHNALGFISAISSTDVWATGCSACGSDIGVDQTILIEHWDGKQWTINPAPLVGHGDNPGGVLGFPSGSLYLAGTSTGTTRPFQTLILHAREVQ